MATPGDQVTTESPLFRFDLWAASWSRDPYYVRWWDTATPITVVATNREGAFEVARAALGDPGSDRFWALKVRSVTDARLGDSGGND